MDDPGPSPEVAISGVSLERRGPPITSTPGPCAWCLVPGPFDARDHAFTRALGGTLELAVPACPSCNLQIKNVEGAAARSSMFAVKRLRGGPAKRRKKDPLSGGLDAFYVFAPDPDGGWTEVAFLGPDRPPAVLPQVHIDLANKHGRKRFQAPEELDRLVDALVALRNTTAEQPGEVNVLLLPPADRFYAEPGFLPRVFLSPKGEVCVRARTAKEGNAILLFAIENAEALRNGPGLEPPKLWELSGETPHPFALAGADPLTELRVVAKVALATALSQLGHAAMLGPGRDQVRAFVRGERGGPVPVTWVRPGQELRAWPDHHVALIDVRNGRLRGILIYFGQCYHVDLGATPKGVSEEYLCIAASRRDGKETFLLSHESALQVREQIAGALNARPDQPVRQ